MSRFTDLFQAPAAPVSAPAPVPVAPVKVKETVVEKPLGAPKPVTKKLN